MARYTCVHCDYEGHFSDFAEAAEAAAPLIVRDDHDEHEDEDLLVCPGCGAEGWSGGGGGVYESS